MPQGLKLSDNLIVLYASFRFNNDKHLHLELLEIAIASLIKGKAKFTLHNLLFKTLNSVILLFKLEFFLAISMMEEEYAYILCFIIVRLPTSYLLCQALIVFFSNIKGSNEKWRIITCKSTSIFEQVSISTLRMNASL